MIDRPPEYELTCYCGMKITGTNENGVIALLDRHIESGVFHTSYLRTYSWAVGKELGEGDFLDNVIATATTMRKAIRNANPPR